METIVIDRVVVNGEEVEQAKAQEQAQAQELNLKRILESLLFVGRKPLSVEDINKAIAKEFPEDLILSTFSELADEYQDRGINIHQVAGGYIMTSSSKNADYVHRLLHAKVQTTLTHQALETLAIIAYKQPVTKAEVDRVRGVNSDGPVDTLLSRKLIQEVGRSEAVGRPYLYSTSKQFLRHFGLNDLDSLPPQ